MAIYTSEHSLFETLSIFHCQNHQHWENLHLKAVVTSFG